MLLVKKIDVTWRFCVDYHAFNKIIIHNCYLISVVDELSNELYGFTIFFKFNLKFSYQEIKVKEDDIYTIVFTIAFSLSNPSVTFSP